MCSALFRRGCELHIHIMEDSSAKEQTDVAEAIVHPDVLKKIEELLNSKGVRNVKVNITAGSTKGDNYLGIIAKARVSGTCKDEKQFELNWIVKSAPTIELYRQMIRVDLVYVREVLMYREILPRFRRFQTERGVTDEIGETPVYITSCLEPYRESLVMEDMKALGYVMKERKEPLDLNHVRLVMKAYGRFHAISYAFRDQDPEGFERIRRQTEENFLRNTNLEDMAKTTEMYNKRVLRSLDSERDVGAIGMYEKYNARAFDILLDAIEFAFNDPFAVVGHGDSWINNMLFKYEDPLRPNRPTKVCLLDWQLARFGSPIFDLSYFIFTCTDKALRDLHYDRLIKLYYFSLCAHLIELGSDPEKLLPFEVLLTHLKKYSVFGLYMSTMVLQLMMSDADEIPDWEEGKTQEDMFEAFQFESKNQHVCNQRVRDNVVDFYEKGYLDFLL